MAALESAIERYLQFWSVLHSERRDWLHPDDREIVEEFADHEIHDFKSFVVSRDMGSYERNIVHRGLIPIPHIGDLRAAKVVVLYANPGFDVMDYWAEYERPEFRKRSHESLIGIFNQEFPFHFLDPSFCWTGGFRWWRSRFGSVLNHYATSVFSHDATPHRAAYEHLSARIIALEAFPYHSIRGLPSAMIRKLPSFNAVRMLLGEYVESKVPIVVARSHDLWSLHATDRIHVCPRQRAQSFAPTSEAGRFLIQALSAN